MGTWRRWEPGAPEGLVLAAVDLSTEQGYDGTTVTQIAERDGVTESTLFGGPTDTDMTRGFEIPKSSPQAVARGIFDGVEHEEEDIFPDPMSASIAESWRNGGVKAMERQNASFVAPEPVTA